MLFRWKEDVKVVGVFIDVEEDALRVASVMADALNGRGIEMPAVETGTVISLVFMIQRDCCLNAHQPLLGRIIYSLHIL